MTTTSTTDTGDRTLVRLVLAVLAVLVLAPVFAMALGMPLMAGMGWGWHDGMMAGTAPWWGFGMGLVWLVVLIGLGYLVYRAVVAPAGGEGDAALRELRLAYARGDLTDEEFESRRAVLESDRDGPR